MSVTLKLSDEDAAVVGSILRAVATNVPEKDNAADYQTWFRQVRMSHSGRDLPKILEISGAFRVAVRANER